LWAPRLLVGYGVALIGAGIFRADPADGFPPGSPSGASSQISWHATLHILSGSIGFGCLIAVCFVFARRFARLGRHRAAMASRLVGAVFAIAFAGIATGATSAPINLGFTAAVVASYAWMTATAVDLYRGTRLEEREQALTNR
jgi:heme A synthase